MKYEIQIPFEVDTEKSLLLGTTEKQENTLTCNCNLYVYQPDDQIAIYWMEKIGVYYHWKEAFYLNPKCAALWMQNNNIPLTDELELILKNTN